MRCTALDPCFVALLQGSQAVSSFLPLLPSSLPVCDLTSHRCVLLPFSLPLPLPPFPFMLHKDPHPRRPKQSPQDRRPFARPKSEIDARTSSSKEDPSLPDIVPSTALRPRRALQQSAQDNVQHGRFRRDGSDVIPLRVRFSFRASPIYGDLPARHPYLSSSLFLARSPLSRHLAPDPYLANSSVLYLLCFSQGCSSFSLFRSNVTLAMHEA
jgi:hypothetical protein